MFRSTYDVFTATNGHQALQIIAANQIPLVVSDQRMPEMLGIDLLSKVRELSPNTMRLLLTVFRSHGDCGIGERRRSISLHQ
jgi:YesN/AraC family two-component response regulator